ncbi:MAG TPA: hypothetical protein VHQ22_16675 [Terriglobales bacterium]|nr:hypothetical protein [Terriglobales bacterium]
MNLLPGPAFIVLMLLGVSVLPAQTRKAATNPKPTAEKCGPLAGQLLDCPKFGFTYKVIFGWVDRTTDMQQDENLPTESASDSSKATSPGNDEPRRASSQSAKTLLAVFERPPGAPGETINSAVVIAAEPLANYHGIKTAADYLNPISELAEDRGFKVVNQPYAFAAGTRQLARADFSKERSKLQMWQSSLVMIEKGYIVSFTFIGGSQDEVDNLIGNLTFGPRVNSRVLKERETK